MTGARQCLHRGMVLLAFVAAGEAGAHAQLVSTPASRVPSPLGPGVDRSNPDRVPPEIKERMEKARVDERMRRLQADTDRLLALATSLKQDMDKTDKYTLSLEVVRRADEIEKLARTIRDREKQ